MTCHHCGKKLQRNSIFCPICGQISDTPPAPQHRGKSIYLMTMNILYGIALLTCFICNLAVSHKLSWFFIVLCSVAITFSVTNLPVLLKRGKLIGSALGATISIFALLASCYLITQSPGLVQYAFPIATYPIIIVWIGILVISIKNLNWFFKSAVLTLLTGILSVSMNIWCDIILNHRTSNLAPYLNPTDLSAEVIGNKIILTACFAYFIIGIIAGTVAAVKRRQ